MVCRETGSRSSAVRAFRKMAPGRLIKSNHMSDVINPHDLAPPDYSDPVIEAYKKDVDRTLLRENLKLTVDERFRKFESFERYAKELREAGRHSRSDR